MTIDIPKMTDVFNAAIPLTTGKRLKISPDDLQTVPNAEVWVKEKKVSIPTGLFINNSFVKSSSGKMFETLDPATAKVITSVYEAGSEDVDIAVQVAKEAYYKEWRLVGPEDRAKLLFKLADLMEEHADVLADIEALDNGKARSIAKSFYVPHAVSTLRYFAGWADKACIFKRPCKALM